MSGRVPGVEIFVRVVLYLIGIPLAILLASVAYAVLELVVRWLGRRVDRGVRGALRAVRRLVVRFRGSIRRHGARRAARRGPPVWSATLLVDADEDGELIQPTVHVRGPGGRGVELRVDLVDGDGRTHHVWRRPLPRRVPGDELRLAALAPPTGASVDDLLGWRWDVVVRDRRREHGRWSHQLRPVAGINPEAELEPAKRDPSLPAATESAADDAPLSAEERLLRAIFGDQVRERV